MEILEKFLENENVERNLKKTCCDGNTILRENFLICTGCGKAKETIVCVESHKEMVHRLSRRVSNFENVCPRIQRINETKRQLMKKYPMIHQGLHDILTKMYKRVDSVMGRMKPRPRINRSKIFRKLCEIIYRRRKDIRALDAYDKIPRHKHAHQRRAFDARWKVIATRCKFPYYEETYGRQSSGMSKEVLALRFGKKRN